jgi:dihydroneopterin aldolase
MFKHPLTTVGGLIVAPDGDILLVQSKKWHDLYSLPGGKVEWGETREEAFIREIREETFLKVTNLRFALVQECIFSSEFWRKGHFVMHDFVADLDPSCSKEQVKLNDEAYQHKWISPQQALKLPLHHECRVLIEFYLARLRQVSDGKFGVLGIHQHKINCIIGVYPDERQQEQTLFIDVKVKLNLSACLASGKMKDAVDYVLLAELCSELAQLNRYVLLETFASDILDQCIHRFNAVWAWVRIQKPSAIPTAAYAYVELERYFEEE